MLGARASPSRPFPGDSQTDSSTYPRVRSSWRINNPCEKTLSRCQSPWMTQKEMRVRNVSWQMWCQKWSAATRLRAGVGASLRSGVLKQIIMLLQEYKESKRAALQDFTEWHHQSSLSARHSANKGWCMLTSVGQHTSHLLSLFVAIKGQTIEPVESYK